MTINELVVPKAGMVAVFQHKPRHESCAVRTGVKSAVGTDVIYEGDEAGVVPRAVSP